MGAEPPTVSRAETLRRAFDRSFAEALRIETTPFEDLLAIRVASHPYAVRLAGISGLFADRVITPLPSPVSDLLGIAGFRGVVVPVYDLRGLLGYEGGGAPRWLVLTAGETRLGLAFDQFDGHLRLPRETIATDDRADGARAYAREIARSEEGARPILHLPSLLGAIRKLAHHVV